MSCVNAFSKYKKNLKEIKNAEKSKNEEEKIDALLSNIEEIKRKRLQRAVTQLEVDAIACYKKAE